MLSGKIIVTFEIPDQNADEEGMRPFIALSTMDIVDAAIEHGLPDNSPLLNLIHQAGTEVDLQDLLEEYVLSWQPENRPAAAIEVAERLEALAELFRAGSEKLSLNLKPRHSLYPR